MRLALRISVSSYRGALLGLPKLVDVLRRHHAQATFLFCLGPDRTGRAVLGPLRRHRAAGPQPWRREHGLRALGNGLLWPAPDIGRRAADMLRATRDAGHECAIEGWDRCAWLADLVHADPEWTNIEMRRAHLRYADIFGVDAPGHGAVGWLMNRHALRLTQRFGYHWASDCRGSGPFLPVWDGEPVHCPQVPTTLPTLPELLGATGSNALIAEERLMHLGATGRDTPQVFAASAELEGTVLTDLFERLLTGWREQGYALCTLGSVRAQIDPLALPRHEMILAPLAHRLGPVLQQGPLFLADCKGIA